jgi:hypothetical protein
MVDKYWAGLGEEEIKLLIFFGQAPITGQNELVILWSVCLLYELWQSRNLNATRSFATIETNMVRMFNSIASCSKKIRIGLETKNFVWCRVWWQGEHWHG